jgi:sugar lactone lactonase YvrE
MRFNSARTIVVLLAALVCPLAHPNANDRESVSDQIPVLSGAPTTLTTLPLDSEGLTVDPETQTLYTAEAPDASGECFVRRVTLTGLVSIVGVLPKPSGGPCAPRGLEFRDGHLYIADQGVGATGWVFEMDPVTGQAIVFAAGVAGANGIAFDSRGDLWVTDSLRGLGRVYRREAATGAVEEAFRVPPVANGTTYGGRLGVPNALGIGRQIVYVPVGMQSEVKQVANGIAIVERYSDAALGTGQGRPPVATLYIADTARGAIWTARLDKNGDLAPGQTGCDPTLQDNTLCEDAVFVAHPRLEGADGMVADVEGNLWITANSRQAVVRVDRFGEVTELFRNPVNSQLLRSSADTAEGNTHILEYPSNPVIVHGQGGSHTSTLCVTSTDRAPRDNWPGTVGEIGGPGQNKGKISCF